MRVPGQSPLQHSSHAARAKGIAKTITRALSVVLIYALLDPSGFARTAEAAERITAESLEYPWSAIGRLNLNGRGHCTAFLVGERHIATAAHCLYSNNGNLWPNPEDIHFIAGYQLDKDQIHSKLKSYVVADGFQPSTNPDVAAEAGDWALAELAQPLGRQAGWLALSSLNGLAAESPALMVGYPVGSAHAMTIDSGCALQALGADGRLIVHGCAAPRGDSGSPLLVFDRGAFRVIGINVVALQTASGTSLGGAVPVSELFNRVRFPKAAATSEATVGLNAEGAAPGPGPSAAFMPKRSVAALLVLRGFRGGGPDAIRRFERLNHRPETGQASMALLAELLLLPGGRGAH